MLYTHPYNFYCKLSYPLPTIHLLYVQRAIDVLSGSLYHSDGVSQGVKGCLLIDLSSIFPFSSNRLIN